MSFWTPLVRRATALLWTSNACVALSNEVRRLALVWIAVSLVGEGAAYVAAVQAGSILVLSLWCGAIVDRWDPRHAMVAADAG
ncbi:MAG: MFS transporter, partial [Alphaproteobacteria bacterium]|nr:MFS transporter [Alphaproteobacteria bacterium]